jgi:hypothetical protein
VNEGSTALLVVIMIGVAVALIVAAAWHIWYAMGLSRMFAQHDTEPWRAWVPFMNDAEVFRLGRVDPVKVALFLVPVVNLYALVLKGVAARRLDSAAGRGVGSTVLAVLLPPVWAMIAAQTRPVAPAAVQDREVAPPPGVAFPAPPVPLGAAPTPPAYPGVIGTPIPAALPLAAAPLGAAPAQQLLPASAPAAVAAPSPVPASAPAAAAPVAAGRVAASVVPRPESLQEEPAPLTRRARRDDATAIVRPPAAWDLLLPSGESHAITARTVVLGRNPNPVEPDVQYIAVSDDGRTVSKHHARLEWDGQNWTITDLGSTNGVAVVDAAGVEQTLPAEGTASVVERFVLGDAMIVLRRAGA